MNRKDFGTVSFERLILLRKENSKAFRKRNRKLNANFTEGLTDLMHSENPILQFLNIEGFNSRCKM